MQSEFPVLGAAVLIDDLLKLQTLALDLRRLTPPRSRAQRIGEQRSVYRGQGREFIEMKHYQSGDDVRQIDWRQTAKKQLPFVRVMEEDRHSEHTVWLDLTSSSYFGTQGCFKSVMACHWAAFLIWRFLQLKHPLRLFVRVGAQWQQELRVSAQKDGARACQLLVEAHAYLASQFRTLEPAPAVSIAHWKNRPNLWFIADFLQQDLAELAQQIPVQAISSLTLLQVLDPFDCQLPSAGLLPVKNPQHSGWIASSDARLQQQYNDHFQAHNEALERFAWQANGALFSHRNNPFHWSEVQSWPLYH